MVSQEPSLFRVPHLENVRYGRLDANNEECFQAIRDADIMTVFTNDKLNEENEINKNFEPFGKDHEKDNIISGGEKQRLCIARVFIKKPTILLLDEATSALDKEAESEIQKSLDKLAKNRTCISVAHKINTVENCDQIFVMENGRIIEKGTHQELLSLKRVYYTLYRYSSMN